MNNLPKKLFACFLLFGCATVNPQAQNDDGRIAAGDLVYVEVYRVPEMSSTLQVSAAGMIALPYVGDIRIVGLTPAEASNTVAENLLPILRDPKVTVVKSGVRLASRGFSRAPNMVMELLPLDNADAEAVSFALAGMSSPGGKVSHYKETNTIIITDNPETLKNIINIASRIDRMQSHLSQVRIETKIVEVREGALKEVGIRWFAQGKELGGGFYPLPTQDVDISTAKGGTSPFSNERVSPGNTGSSSSGFSGSRSFVNPRFDRRLQIPVQVPVPGQSFLSFANAHIDIGAMVDALITEKSAEMLANPMTYVVNHQTAVIKMTDEFPYTERATEVTGATNFTTRFLELGITMEVTPHIHQDSVGKYIKLEVKPEVSFPIGTGANGVPIRSVRSATTVANVRDGQTLVIGGILREDQRDLASKVPGLGNIPLLGKLFKHTEKAKQRTELMIFVTPTIYDAPEDITWDKMIDISEELQKRDLLPLADLRGEARKD